MSNMNIAYGAASTLMSTALNGLGAGSVAVSAAVNNTTGAFYVDYLVDMLIQDIGESGNKRLLLAAVSSLDGTNFADTTMQSNWIRLGYLDVDGATSALRTGAKSVAAAFGGAMPPYFKILVFNDAGTSLAGSGNTVTIIPIYYTST